MQEQHRLLSVALVYLEQCRHDEQPLCGRTGTLLAAYQSLREKVLHALCKLWEILDGLQVAPPTVTRAAMPLEHRLLSDGATWTAQRSRAARDYVVSADVKAVLLNALSAVNGTSDWSSSASSSL